MEDLQKQLEYIEEETLKAQAATKFRSRIYQPDRISITNYKAVPQANNTLLSVIHQGYINNFRMKLQLPVIKAKTLQLLRSTIPQPTLSIPDEETYFWYYRIDPDDIQTNPFQLSNLHFIRLLPSAFPIDQLYTNNTDTINWAVNQYFANYEALLTQLNLACITDPLQGYLPPIPFEQNYYYLANEIQFGFDKTQNKFYMNGLDTYDALTNPTGWYYCVAAYNDPNITLALAAINAIDDDPATTYFGPDYIYQTPRRTLNLRLGFLWDGNGLKNPIAENFRFRPPILPVLLTLGVPRPGDTVGAPYDKDASFTANGYADLVYSANCYCYADIVASSANFSGDSAQLLATIPMDGPTLGVSFFNNLVNHPLTKGIEEIYEINITLKTDTDEPFWTPLNSIFNLELGFTYD